MDVEEKIAKIERISVRLALLILCVIGLVALVIYGGIKAFKFIADQLAAMSS